MTTGKPPFEERICPLTLITASSCRGVSAVKQTWVPEPNRYGKCLGVMSARPDAYEAVQNEADKRMTDK